jgi:hypothetical protein
MPRFHSLEKNVNATKFDIFVGNAVRPAHFRRTVGPTSDEVTAS